ncbi:MAG: ankyrin repeat domain-containing protein [Casimicrobiaceae bacterium]
MLAAGPLGALPWLAGSAQAANPSALYENAKRAITAGKLVPERDLAPLVAILRAPGSTDELRGAIDKIETLGEASGSSPPEVKHYLLEQSTPLLLQVGKTGPTSFARGEALMALRNMGASRAVLDQAATIAEQDRDDFVRSRGEILRNFMKGMPVAGAAADVKGGGGEREKKATAALKARGLGISADQLRRSSLQGKADEVQLLVDAGVNVNSGAGLSDSAIYFAVFSGCGAKQGESDALASTVGVLIASGADLKRRDDNGNTIMMSAAQMCGPKIVTQLATAGAEINVANRGGVTPLAMALIMHHPDAADALVARGARLSSTQVQMVSGSATDARAQAFVKRATGK